MKDRPEEFEKPIKSTSPQESLEIVMWLFRDYKAKADKLEATLVDIGLHWKCEGKAGELARLAQKALAEYRGKD